MGSEISKLADSVCNSSAQQLDAGLSHRIFDEIKTDLLQAKRQQSPGFELRSAGQHGELYFMKAPNGQTELAIMADVGANPILVSAVGIPCPGNKLAVVRFDRAAVSTIEHLDRK
jgi:hypothetical protein